MTFRDVLLATWDAAQRAVEVWDELVAAVPGLPIPHHRNGVFAWDGTAGPKVLISDDGQWWLVVGVAEGTDLTDPRLLDALRGMVTT
jgi:hypothetical protein